MHNYIFLKPVDEHKYRMRGFLLLEHNPVEAMAAIREDEPLHFDIETTGLSPLEGAHIISVSWANSDDVVVAPTAQWDDEAWQVFFRKLIKCGGIAYNSNFDYMHLVHKAKQYGMADEVLDSMAGCSLTLFRSLANEKFFGQTYSLQAAQEFLKLPTNKTWLKEKLQEHNLKKSEMYKLLDLEYTDFLKYNAEDSDTSYALWKELTSQLASRDMSHVLAFHQEEQVEQIKELIVQYFSGIRVDREKLAKHAYELDVAMHSEMYKFKSHPTIKEWLPAFEDRLRTNFYQAKVQIKKHRVKAADFETTMADESAMVFTDLKARPTAKWMGEYGGKVFTAELQATVKNINKPCPLFNMNSGEHLKELFYNHLYSYTPTETNWGKKQYTIHLPDRDVTVDATKEGGLPVGKEVYPIFGELGNILAKYNKLEKELGYVSKALKVSERDGYIHPQFIPYGTATGRLAGSGGINMQQQPKSQGYLECFLPKEGYKFVDVDVSALEPNVQAEFSKDPTLIEIYASGEVHDLYLWWTRFIHPNPDVREALSAEYKPGHENIEVLKKKWKKERQFMKAPILGFSYNMGPYKLHKGWTIAGYDVTIDDCKEVRQRYWDKLQGVKQWEQQLIAEWESRGGWIMSGFGHPLSVPEEYKKDLINRFTQATGHTVLMILNRHIQALIKERGIKTEVPVISDFHDERISMCREEEAEALSDVFREAFVRLNEELKPDIPFKGEPMIASTFWELKA